MRALVSELPRNKALADAFRRSLVEVRRDELRVVLERGVARGELPGRPDDGIAADLLIGPVYYRALLSGQPFEPRHAERVVDAFLRGAAPRPGTGTSKPR
jgi:hypothetical protein